MAAKTTEVAQNRTCSAVTSSNSSTPKAQTDAQTSSKPPTRPLVSVIIPVYNVAKILERCVDSVLAQTYDNLEIILIDDGSTDMSKQFCDVFAKKDPRVRVIHQPNRGLSAARNAGLDLATGDFVTFVDSDDSVQPYLVEFLLNLCLQHRTKMSITGFRELSPESEIFPNLAQRADLQQPLTQRADLKAQSETQPNPNNLPDLTPAPENVELLTTTACLTRMLCEQGFTVSAWSKLYSRDLFATVRFPESKLYEDVGTTYRLVLQCPEIAVSPEQPYNYYHNPGSITKQSFTMSKLDLITLTDQMCDDLLAWSASRDPAERTQLELLTAKRRMHARFSVLRQMVMIDPKSLPLAAPQSPKEPSLATSPKTSSDRKSFLAERRRVVRYLRAHHNDLLANPLASRRDRLAMAALLLGLPAFRAAWRRYDHQKQRHR